MHVNITWIVFNDDSFLEYFIISNGCSLIGEKSPRSNLMET